MLRTDVELGFFTFTPVTYRRGDSVPYFHSCYSHGINTLTDLDKDVLMDGDWEGGRQPPE